MSGDPEQEYFADGMVEDIITALCRFKQLFVIARNSSFTYKGRAVDLKQKAPKQNSVDKAMKLTATQVKRTLSQFNAEVLPDSHPAVPDWNTLFGDHRLFLDSDGPGARRNAGKREPSG